MATKKSTQPFKLGDRVKILYSDWSGRIVEEWGALGPGGMLVFRVRVPHKPKPVLIDLCEDQLVAIPATPNGEPTSSARRGARGQPKG